MSLIGKNIKNIRNLKNISQNEFSRLFNISRASVGAYEEGRAEPRLETIINIANYFSISIDTLLTKELSTAELKQLDIAHHKPLSTIIEDRDLRREDTPLVKRDQYIEYIVNHQHKDFINKLPFVRLPDTQHQKSRAFEMQNDAMETNRKGLLKGDILSCSAISVDKNLTKDLVYVVVSSEDIYVRRFVGNIKKMVFKADNPNYELLELEKSDMLELWRVNGFYSTALKPPLFLEERVALLERKMSDLENHLKSLHSL